METYYEDGQDEEDNLEQDDSAARTRMGLGRFDGGQRLRQCSERAGRGPHER